MPVRQRLNGAWLSLNLGLLSSSPFWPKLWLRRHPNPALANADPQTLIAFQQVLQKSAAARARDLIHGIRAYQNHPASLEDVKKDCKAECIWESGTTRLLSYEPYGDKGAAVFIIPSLINRYDILDLDADHSFLRFLAQRGFRPFVVDWGVPGEEEKTFSINDYVGKRLVPALDFICARVGQEKIHTMGYCLGGLFALALAFLREGAVKSLILMATPWHMGTTTLGEGKTAFNLPAQDYIDIAESLEEPLKKMDYLPVSFLQIMFGAMQPSYVSKKFASFAKMDHKSAKARRFVLTEDWLNDGIPLANPVARELLADIYGANVTGKMQWMIGANALDPRALRVPTFVIVPSKDRIVPRESSLPLARLIRGSKLLEPKLGHVGLLVSDRAPDEVWAPLADWLEQVK
jgi:polyhydroxyalkanoate synthase subunit PhaC